MIRLIGRRLIIPRGDTGSFTIPIQGTVEVGDLAFLSIYDPLTKKTICEIKLTITQQIIAAEALTFMFTHQDTVNIEPSDRYEWDIKIYYGPQYDNGELIGATEINSYYAAFGKSMPKCVIKQVAQDV